ncbi:uncharacterized protein [Dermacentor andersoni]|uniref:uncharacterized protein isoform X2 n=1 Tax=Dermacentor andersoni TaxID=34620 RepID=UPI002415A871|nr:uncharacterized protein LOC126529382 isoform X2 [Dermacentor andersoni]
MTWKFVYVTLVLNWRLLSIVKCSSCEDANQKRVYCTKSGAVRQNMCPRVARVPCSTGTWPCACVEPLLRSADGACVQKHKCDPKYRTPKPRTTKFPRGTYIPGGAWKTLENPKRLVQVLITTNQWLASDCFCMDSDYVESFPPRKVVRTVSCRMYRKFGSFNNAMVKFSAEIMFELGVEDSVTVFYLRTYRSGNDVCSLWGPENASGIDEQVCFDTFNRDCNGEKTISYPIHRERCELHDKLAQEHDKKPGSK